MSRDLKPFELYLLDQRTDYGMRNTKITFFDSNGEEVRVDNHIAKDRYPELSFLLDGFDNLYRDYESDKTALTVLDEIEDCLKKAEADFMTAKHTGEDEIEQTVKEWFYGRLDNGYYMNENNRLFYEFITEKITREKEKGEFSK